MGQGDLKSRELGSRTLEKCSGTWRLSSEASLMPLSQRALKWSHRTRSTHLSQCQATLSSHPVCSHVTILPVKSCAEELGPALQIPKYASQ